MKLIMGISADGFVAKSPVDDMSWLGLLDKRVFRILTGVGGVCGVSTKTKACMPHVLSGRELIGLSLSVPGRSLDAFHDAYPDGWLLGGQTLALRAFEKGYITEAHLCISSVRIGAGIRELLTGFLSEPVMTTTISDRGDLAVTVEAYRGDGIRKAPG